MTNELKPINFGLNKFCVPAVMSSLTGRSTDECAAVITSINGRQEIKAVNTSDIIKAFEKLRFDVEEKNIPASTLFGVLNRLASQDGLYLILVPSHIVAVRIDSGQIQICDNASREPLDAKQSSRLTQHVNQVFKVSPKPQPVFVKSEIRAVRDLYMNKVTFYRDSIYEKAEDNVQAQIGYIYYQSKDEVKEMIKELEKI